MTVKCLYSFDVFILKLCELEKYCLGRGEGWGGEVACTVTFEHEEEQIIITYTLNECVEDRPYVLVYINSPRAAGLRSFSVHDCRNIHGILYSTFLNFSRLQTRISSTPIRYFNI